MLPIRHSTTCLALLAVCFVLMGVGCGDSDDDDVLIDGEAEPAVVTIIDGWHSQPKRSDAEILTHKILQRAREAEDFYFDIPQRNQLIDEIEQVLSAVRAAYPSMNEIHAVTDLIPGVIVVSLERDFYEIVRNKIQDKQGQIRFETGYAEFDALNAKLEVQAVYLGSSIGRHLVLYFHNHLNLNVAGEAYSMVEGVERAYPESTLGISTDIKAFKQGQTWYVIFRNAWGDCPAGCIYQELFCFTVTGTDVEMIPTAQAQTMPPFQELDSRQRNWLLHNATPFINTTAHTWSWGESLFSRGRFVGFALGCSLFGEIEASPDQLRVSCGYRVPEPLPLRDRFDNFEFAGVVLLLVATQERTVIGKEEAHSTVVASEAVQVAKTAAEVQSPENVYFENVLMPIDPPPLSTAFERWWGAVHPTFIVCWDDPETGLRYYQFLTPSIMLASAYEARNHPGCDNFKNPYFLQTLDLHLPTLNLGARSMGLLYGIKIIPDSKNGTNWIDEVLPRPAAPESVD